MKKLFFLILILFSQISFSSETFNFSEDEKLWQFYGEGLGGYVTNEGLGEPRHSIWLSGELESSKTAFFEWDNLKPGKYLVSFYVKAQDVLPNRDQTSFWSFYDSGKGTQDVFRDLNGSFEWKRVEKVIFVAANKLTYWFRIKSSGDVWIDKFELKEVPGSQVETPVVIAPSRPLILKKAAVKSIVPQTKKVTLFNFNADEYGHPFTRRNDQGEFLVQTFYDFDISKLSTKDWSAYDHIEMSVFNPNNDYVEFFFTIADDKSQNYWGQLNHKQTLAPGLNKITFSLKDYVGERGSHRFFRSLNLKKLKKIYVVIDPDKKTNFEKKRFLIDDIILSSNPLPLLHKDLKFFNFTGHKSNIDSNYTNVYTSTLYNEERGYGFIDPNFWRVEDSVFASEIERYTIGLLKGKFRIKLPNGAYQIKLNVDKLGYWDVPFWSNKTIIANGDVIYKATRNTGAEMLRDLLRFENVIPKNTDHPYDLYLSKVFETIEKDVQVKNGYLDLDFEGDASAISLNTLLIYKRSLSDVAQKFYQDLNQRNKLEFDWMSKPIKPSLKDSGVSELSVVSESLTLNPIKVENGMATEIKWTSGKEENVYKFIQVKGQELQESVSWEISELKHENGKNKITDPLEVAELIYQYSSPDLNHETYMISGKYLKNTNDKKVLLNKKENKYLVLKLKIKDSDLSGNYSGSITFSLGRKKYKLPIELKILNYTLKNPLNFPVGFFGIDPISHSYFSKDQFENIRQKYRMLAIKKLLSAGFTTFSGLPKNEKDLNEIFNYSKAHGVKEVYSYGGSFLQDIDSYLGESNEIKLREYSIGLKKILSNPNWPKIVYTFSDEAGGYSDKMQEDIAKAKKLRSQFPYLELGGFGSYHSKESEELNKYFKVGFYSSMNANGLSKIKNSNNRWGGYNGAPGNLDDPRGTLGPWLYFARKEGLSHYLEWHATAFNNYPYYDFDGRESDVVLFYPQSSGELLNSMRFELAQEGIQTYKKLLILEKRIAKNSKSLESKEAQKWLVDVRKNFTLQSDKNFMSNKNFNFNTFKDSLNSHLEKMFK